MPQTTYIGRAEAVGVYSDEDGWNLVIETDTGNYTCNIHGIPEQVIQQAKRLDNYLEEGRDAAASYQENLDATAEAQEAYALNDPKHPEYHSTHADIWDARADK